MPEDIRTISREDFFKLTRPEEKVKFLLKYAILAPSMYNSQPWLFRVAGSACTFYKDTKVQIKEADREGRGLYISIGAALENLIIASKYFGVFGGIEYIVDDEKDAAARISFKFGDDAVIDKEYEKLVDFMPRRQNARGVFKTENLPLDLLPRLSMLQLLDDFIGIRADFITNKAQILSLGKLNSDGLKLASRSSAFRAEMANWLRSNYTADNDGLPGYALKVPGPLSLIVPSLVRLINFGPLLSYLDFQGFRSAPAVCVLGSQENNPTAWLKIGRLTERLSLEFAARGYGTSIFTAAVQIGELYKEVQKVVYMTERPQLTFCVGRVSRSHHLTPRHNVESKCL